MRTNDDELIAAIHKSKLPPDLGGLYSDLKPFLRAHGVEFSDAMAIAHYFEAALIDARASRRSRLGRA